MHTIKIHIIGAPGSGKTHTAAKLSALLAIPAFDLDELSLDLSGKKVEPRDNAERDAKLRDILTQDAWIIEGAYHSWLAPAFQQADLILILHAPVWVRYLGILARFVKRKVGLAPSRPETLVNLYNVLRYSRSYERMFPEARNMIASLNRDPLDCYSYREMLNAIQSALEQKLHACHA